MMAFDEGLAQRIRESLDEVPGLTEKKMFGGISFLLEGNMACGVIDADLIVRVGPDGYEAGLSQPHTRPFDFTGRTMKGWVVVNPEGVEADDDLKRWVYKGVDFARTLPPR
jgi:TfoX/Sxy family transcriptional regulator of competence genes